MTSLDRNAELTDVPSQKLRQASEFSGRPLDLRVTEFGRFIADRMNPKLIPMGFVMASVLAMEDLKRGIDGFKQAPLTHPLVGQPAYVYDLLFLNVPTLARVAFSEPFADDVAEQIRGISSKSGLEEDAWILAPVVTIEQAEVDIIDSARKRVMRLNWKHFDLQDRTEDIAGLYEASYPLILRQAGMNFPLNILREDVYDEALALRLIDPTKKGKLIEGYSLALTKEEISVEEATLIRDWLVMKAPEGIAGMFNLSPEEVILYFIQSDRTFLQAGLRTRTNLANRGTN